MHNIRYAFFGTPTVAVGVLEELVHANMPPHVVITAPDAPQGRGLALTAPPVKVWAEKHHIPVLQPEKLDDAFLSEMRSRSCDLFIVAAYGKIIPEKIFHLPRYETLNVHPSLLPRLRGASPIQSAIIEETETGVSIMLVDAEMDHGPVIAQKKVSIDPWPPKTTELERILATEGGKLLVEIIPHWISGSLVKREQMHTLATYCKKFTPADALIDLADDSLKNFHKIQAFDHSPRAHFFAEHHGKKMRVIITDAALEEGKIAIKRVLPVGKKEMLYADFLRGN
ncbi:MAG: methionyl-tRNA formyltransferase [Minisyncoccota bacterium]